VRLEARFAKADLDVSAFFCSPTAIVKLVGYGIDSLPELDNRPVGGIGFLGLHQESDYEPVSGIAFSEDSTSKTLLSTEQCRGYRQRALSSRFVSSHEKEVELVNHCPLCRPDLFRHMKYIFDRTFEPLLPAAREGSTSLSCLQWRALVRFLWLRDLYVARLATFSQRSESFLDGCKEMLDKMKVHKNHRLFRPVDSITKGRGAPFIGKRV
jgi:hypothetical protein